MTKPYSCIRARQSAVTRSSMVRMISTDRASPIYKVSGMAGDRAVGEHHGLLLLVGKIHGAPQRHIGADADGSVLELVRRDFQFDVAAFRCLVAHDDHELLAHAISIPSSDAEPMAMRCTLAS